MITTFDFMSDQSLRNSLESDYHELEECMKAKAWKAVHVLAGSIIETLLLDYLVETEYSKRTSKNLKDIRFFEMINICKSDGVLTNKSAELSHVIREFRNLIHPERAIRISETVDEDSATVAQALVRMVVGEITAKRKQTYGYTAEQIIKKIEADSSVLSIITDLLKNTKENEKRELLLNIIPQKYLSLSDPSALLKGINTSKGILDTLAKCFRYTFEVASNETKKVVAKEFLRIIKEESTPTVRMYELLFFKGTDLEYFPSNEIQIVTKHILSTLQHINVYKRTLENIKGIGKFLEKAELEKLVDIIMKEFITEEYELISARDYLDIEYQSMSEERKEIILDRLKVWEKVYKNRNNEKSASDVQSIMMYLELEPFGAIDDESSDE